MEGEPVGIAVGADSRYQLNPELMAQHWGSRTVAALVASPSNPTGTLIAAEDSCARWRHSRAQRGGTLIVDEIYHGLVYEGEATTALALSRRCVRDQQLLEVFHMTGWRLGWMVAPEAYVRDIDKLSQNIYLSAPTPSQYAALAAFEPETIGDTRSAAQRIPGAARLPGAGAAQTRLRHSGTRRKARSTSTPDCSSIDRRTALPSRTTCWRTRAWPSRRASISAPMRRSATCASPIRGPLRSSRRACAASRVFLAAEIKKSINAKDARSKRALTQRTRRLAK